MEAKEFDKKYRNRFEKLATTNLADVLDKEGIRGRSSESDPCLNAPRSSAGQ